MYRSLGQYQAAIVAYTKAQSQFGKLDFAQGKAGSLIGLGNAYNLLGQYDRAINFYQQSLEIKREIGDRKGEAASLGNLGLVYDSLGQYDRAINFQEQSLEIVREIGDRKGEAASLFNKALALARYEPRRFEALTTIQQARTIYKQLTLEHMVEKCDKAIHDFNQIIATEQRQSAPTLPVAPTIGNPPAQDNWYERSLPTPPKPRPTSQRQPNYVLWFCVGFAIVLLIAWLRK